jgi:hypothetical protein
MQHGGVCDAGRRRAGFAENNSTSALLQAFVTRLTHYYSKLQLVEPWGVPHHLLTLLKDPL